MNQCPITDSLVTGKSQNASKPESSYPFFLLMVQPIARVPPTVTSSPLIRLLRASSAYFLSAAEGSSACSRSHPAKEIDDV
jgi:hypothetical protein